MSEELFHYGTPRHSGRYPWGSGDTPYQRNTSFLGYVHKLKNQGVKETEIAKGMNMNTSQLRKNITLATIERRAYEASEALRLKDKGYSTSAIARRMGKNESSIRGLLNQALRERSESSMGVANILKESVEKYNYIDVGAGAEHHVPLGITSHKLNTALELLKREGYVIYPIYVEQLGTGKNTTVMTLAKPGATYGEVAKNKDQIKMVSGYYSEDGGEKIRKIEPPKSIDSKRLAIRYGEEGGSEKDGLIELRRGVDDISLGKAKYAQVRIAVDGTHYIKGMATYSDNLPEGVDILFNTNKKPGTSKLDALKPMKDNPDNPFGASIKMRDDELIMAQRHYKDKDGNEQLSALNIVYEEGNWSKWTKSLASQMLSKQFPALAKQQLDLSHSIAKDELDEIMSFTNPTVRAALLDKFASQCDSDATHLKAAALPGQSNKVILPRPDMPPTEVYAPGYKDGEHVALVRYPHGGPFEIPILVVNNKRKDVRQDIGQAIDAIGINSKVAERLSGADFDGDSVVVIPVDNVKIKSTPPLKGLENFNPRETYKGYNGMPEMTDHDKGLEMGLVSNLITDMTVKGAPAEEICRAVRHSMVVIDAKNHKLNYKQSEIDHGIAELKKKYQGGEKAGASTLLSRASAEDRPHQRKLKVPSKMTPEELAAYKEGKVIWEYTGKTYTIPKTMKDGSVKLIERPHLEKSTRMMETDDAFTLVSGTRSTTTPIEAIYANYANGMKALANAARKAARMQQDIPYNPSARDVYSKEVASLNAQLNIAEKNAPLERQAQLIANKIVSTKLHNNPGLDYEHKQRLKGQELENARWKVGAKKISIYITDREWEAINAGAIRKTNLARILANAKLDRVRELATPRSAKGLSSGKVARAKNMISKGYTQAEIAEALNVSVDTLIRAVGITSF